MNDINDDPDHDATFLPLVRELAALDLAYLHLAERAGRELTGRIRAAWPYTLVLNPDTGSTPTGPEELRLIEDGTTDLLAFGAHFIANPDLPHRLATGALSPRATVAHFSAAATGATSTTRPRLDGESGAQDSRSWKQCREAEPRNTVLARRKHLRR
ncbi:hypothetical protein NKG94_37000 [Micromonospora sp. M12]